MAVLMLFLLALSSEGYQRIGDKHDVTVYRRDGHAIDLAAEGDIAASPDVVLKVLTDYASHPKWVHGLSTSQVIDRDAHGLDVYQRLKLPMLEDRDFALRVDWSHEGDNRTIKFHSSQKGPPPTNGCIRVPLHEGSWHLEALDGGTRTHAVYRFRMELGGSLPMWMARGRAGKDVPDLFEAIRRQVQYYR